MPEFRAQLPAEGVSRREAAKETFRRADFEQIGTGYFVVTFCALSLKSTRETARARKRTIPNIGLVTECLILLDKAALWC
jgi:hypothetical protein